jgi:hypothetical protein
MNRANAPNYQRISNNAILCLLIPTILIFSALGGCATGESDASRSGWGDTRANLTINLGNIGGDVPMGLPSQDENASQQQSIDAVMTALDAKIDAVGKAMEAAAEANDAKLVATLSKELEKLSTAKEVVARPGASVFFVNGDLHVTVSTTGTTDTKAAGDTQTTQTPSTQTTPTVEIPITPGS